MPAITIAFIVLLDQRASPHLLGRASGKPIDRAYNLMAWSASEAIDFPSYSARRSRTALYSSDPRTWNTTGLLSHVFSSFGFFFATAVNPTSGAFKATSRPGWGDRVGSPTSFYHGRNPPSNAGYRKLQSHYMNRVKKGEREFSILRYCKWYGVTYDVCVRSGTARPVHEEGPARSDIPREPE